MPIMVVFDPPFATRPPGSDVGTCTLGPYRVATLFRDQLLVYDGLQLVVLASRDPSGNWLVNGLEGLVFEAVRFLPPPEQAAADLHQAEREHDGGPDQS